MARSADELRATCRAASSIAFASSALSSARQNEPEVSDAAPSSGGALS
jgi:hypothetical protein